MNRKPRNLITTRDSPHTLSKLIQPTLSFFWKPFTSEPTSSMTPAGSCEPMNGNGVLKSLLRVIKSVWQKPAALIRTRTWCGLGRGTGTSQTRYGSLYCCIWIAFMVVGGIAILLLFDVLESWKLSRNGVKVVKATMRCDRIEMVSESFERGN